MKHLEKIPYKILFSILILAIAGIVFFLKIGSKTDIASAAWWNDGWHYRKAISIENSSGSNQNNVQIKLLDDYDLSTLVTEEKVKSNLSDIRFVDINGQILSYWVEDSTSESVDIWILLSSVPDSGSIVYMYYGNNSALDSSDNSWMADIGGTISNSNGYRIHTFKDDNTYTNYFNRNIEILVVAGGGGGGGQGNNDGSGGGGAGGLIYNSSYSISSGSINVTVGNGGSGVSFQTLGNNGQNSVFSTLTAIGGGGAGAEVSGARNGKAGGSGGGAGGYSTIWVGGVGTSGQGNKGGDNIMPTPPNKGGGGGGGASTVGIGGGFGIENHASGGDGLSYSISGVGVSYAGGGGDGGGYSGYGGLGGSGGGGKGGSSVAGQATGTSGTPNTGGGGGGGGGKSVGGVANSGSGGSGIVIVRYQSTINTPTNITVNNPATEEIGTAPIAYWKFDEGVGTTAYDSTSNQNNGTIVGATWQTEDQCISGKCLYFNGSANYVNIPNNKSLNPTGSFTISINVLATTIPTGETNFIDKNGYREYRMGMTASGFIHTTINITNGTTTKFVNDYGSTKFYPQLNHWYHYEYVFDATLGYVYFYVNGKLFGNTSVGTGFYLVTSTQPLYFGKYGSYYFSGLIDEPKIYPYARTADQIKQDYNSRGSSKGTSVNLGIKSNTSPYLSSKLVAHYKFDEGNGTTANNSVNDSSLNGTITGATWSKENKSGKSISFLDTSNDYILSNNNANLSGDQTFSTWVYPKSTSGLEGIITNHNHETNSNIGINMVGTRYSISIGYTDGSREYNTKQSNQTVALNKWTHLTLKYNLNENSISLYINGKLDNQWTLTKTVKFTSGKILIGQWSTAYLGNYKFNGLIDEVKIYNTALTDEEIKQDYNQGSAITFSATNQTIGGTTTSLEYCVPDDTSHCASPVGEWNFEENTGTTTNDTSGNNNTGTINGATWTQGKIGAATNFDGSTNKYISLTNSIDLGNQSWTASGWVQIPSSVSGRVGIFLGNYPDSPTINLEVHTAKMRLYWNGVDMYGTTNLNDSKWHYLTWIRDKTSDKFFMYIDGSLEISFTGSGSDLNITDPFWIGSDKRSGGMTWHGKIDQVRIYDYARNPSQVAYDYNKGAPIGWWKLDECQGSTANDSSGNSNNGAITIGASGSQDYLGTCQIGTSAAWTNGAIGHINSSLNFDGTDDYIDLGNNSSLDLTSEFTLSTWLKSDTGDTGYILGRFQASDAGYMMRWNNTNLTLYYGNTENVSSSSFSSTNNWVHAVITFNNGIVNFYRNGLLIGTNSEITINSAPSINNTIGSRWGGSTTGHYFQGQIDDARIYNYALTNKQIKTVYNGGATNFR